MQSGFSHTLFDAAPGRSNALASNRWQLWIDRGGGYQILQGKYFSIGGPGGDDPADIAVRYRWSRRMATLIRWDHGDAICLGAELGAAAARPLGPDQDLPISPEADEQPLRLRYQRPCPLSGSAVVMVLPPHRLCGPADATVLFDQTLLIGPEAFNHIRVAALSAQGWVLFRRGDQWWIRGTHVAPQPIGMAQRWQHEDWSLMIREA